MKTLLFPWTTISLLCVGLISAAAGVVGCGVEDDAPTGVSGAPVLNEDELMDDEENLDLEKTLTDSELKTRLFHSTAMTLTQGYLAGTTNPTPDGKHAGVDYGGTWPVYAPVNGYVRDATSVCGKVVLEDERSYGTDTYKPKHIFLHMKDIKVTTGSYITEGTLIGTSSNVVGGGCVASAAHLHYEIRKNYSGTSAVGTTSGTSTAALTYDPFGFDFPNQCANPLPAPTLVSPSNGATNVSKTAQNFALMQVYCGTTYRIVLCTDSTCSGWSDTSSTCTNTSTCKTATSSTPSYAGWSLTANKKYYWKARAGNSNAGGTWSSIRSFTTSL